MYDWEIYSEIMRLEEEGKYYYTFFLIFIRLLMGRESEFLYEQCSVQQDILAFVQKLKISPDVVIDLLQRVRWGRMAHARSIGLVLVIGVRRFW